LDTLQLVAGIGIFVAAVAVLYVVVTRGTRKALGPKRRLETELGMEQLQGRLARGEISQAEFDQAQRALGG
jgi:uncharacterized membrane protein